MTSGLEHKPTDESRLIVKELYAAGVTVARLAERFDIHEETLRKHYREELEDSLENMNSTLAKGLYADALSGDKAAREFWLKCRARWSYAKAPEDTAKDEKTQTLMEKLIDKL